MPSVKVTENGLVPAVNENFNLPILFLQALSPYIAPCGKGSTVIAAETFGIEMAPQGVTEPMMFVIWYVVVEVGSGKYHFSSTID